MNISASIVTYLTDPAELSDALDALDAAEVDDVTVVDNSPTDLLRKECGRIKYIYNGANIGYGAAHNVAIKAAVDRGSRYHLVMNTDIEFAPDAVNRLAAYLDDNSDAVMVTPRMVYPDGRLQFNVRLLPTPLNVFGRRFLPRRWIAAADARYTLAAWDHSYPIDIAYHQGSFMLFRTAILGRIGGFDERFFMYPEDIDITRRMHRLGATVYLPEVTITHNHRAASYHSLRMTWIHCINMVRYFNKWGWWHDPERRLLNRKALADTGMILL